MDFAAPGIHGRQIAFPCNPSRSKLPPQLATNFSSRAVYFMQDANDADLVTRTLAGETEAFEVLVNHHQRVLFRVALRMLGDYADAADATQSAFIKAYERLGSFDPRFRFFSWIYRILVNECLNTRRSRKPHEETGPEPAADSTPFEAAASAELRVRVQRALLTLPIESRQVVVLRHFAGLSYDEIAEAVGVPSKTVKSRLYSARQRLCELLIAEKVAR
jgi:RNA polymerase sigma-70 factor, ECF subfamily